MTLPLNQVDIITRYQRCMIAFSGGPDSIYLADRIRRLVKPDDLLLVYCDHGLRPQAADEIALTKTMAHQWDVSYVTIPLEVRKVAQQSKESIETVGRSLRYQALEKIAHDRGFKLIATAHHQDDDCESFLFKIIRGTTRLNGIQSMIKLSSDIIVIRPLLAISKSDILSYLSENKIPYAIDQSNFESIYTRNKIRHTILPQIEQINPRYREHFQQIMTYYDELETHLHQTLQPILDQATVTPNQLTIPLTAIEPLDPFLRKKVVFTLLKMAYTSIRTPDQVRSGHPIDWKHIHLIERLIITHHLGPMDLPQGWRCQLTLTDLVFRLVLSG